MIEKTFQQNTSSDTDFTNLKVIIIDDKQDSRSLLKGMLSGMGVTQIFESSDGRKGLDFIDTAPDLVDLIICDWNMPEMSGVELLRQLRSTFSKTLFLMVTGRKDMDSVLEAKQSGVDGYLGKPFSTNELKNKIEKILIRNQHRLNK